MNFANVTKWTIPEGDVIRVTDSQNRVIWKRDDPYDEYFYFENVTDTSHPLRIILRNPNDIVKSFVIHYSYDTVNWTAVTVRGSYGSSDLNKLIANVPANTKIYLKTTSQWWPDGRSGNCYAQFGITNVSAIANQQWFKIGGNFMSLVNGTLSKYFNNVSNYMGWAFETGGIYSAADLLLPFDTVEYCYDGLFESCYDLVIPPQLPALILSDHCYASMFSKALSSSKWGLQYAPDLLAPTLVDSCYSNMFYNQKLISSVKCLATSGINTNNSTYYWLRNAPDSGTFYKKAGVTWPMNNVSGIPSGWTVVEQ